MPKFTVRLVAASTVYHDIEVEAKDDNDAEDKALARALQGIPYSVSEGNHLDWEIVETEELGD